MSSRQKWRRGGATRQRGRQRLASILGQKRRRRPEAVRLRQSGAGEARGEAATDGGRAPGERALLATDDRRVRGERALLATDDRRVRGERALPVTGAAGTAALATARGVGPAPAGAGDVVAAAEAVAGTVAAPVSNETVPPKAVVGAGGVVVKRSRPRPRSHHPPAGAGCSCRTFPRYGCPRKTGCPLLGSHHRLGGCLRSRGPRSPHPLGELRREGVARAAVATTGPPSTPLPDVSGGQMSSRQKWRRGGATRQRGRQRLASILGQKRRRRPEAVRLRQSGAGEARGEAATDGGRAPGERALLATDDRRVRGERALLATDDRRVRGERALPVTGAAGTAALATARGVGPAPAGAGDVVAAAEAVAGTVAAPVSNETVPPKAVVGAGGVVVKRSRPRPRSHHPPAGAGCSCRTFPRYGCPRKTGCPLLGSHHRLGGCLRSRGPRSPHPLGEWHELPLPPLAHPRHTLPTFQVVG